VKTDTLQSRLLGHFERFHRRPELGFCETETTAHIRSALEEAGIEILDSGLKTGLIAIIRGKKSPANAKTIALRADIDALPLNEETDLQYKSEIPGAMHACGHDFHTSALLGAAFLLKERENDLCGTAKLIFQPAEEVTGGAKAVINTGFLDDVAEIYGLHVGPDPDAVNGTVAISAGATFASAVVFSIEVKGRGGHAAMPHMCKDPVPALAQLINSAQSIVSRSTNPLDRVVVSFTHIEAGSTWNIIPSSAKAEGTIRALGSENAEIAVKRLSQICEGIAIASETKISLDSHMDTLSTNNNAALCESVKTTALTLGMPVEVFVPTMASEDFALYQQKIPGVFLGFAVKSPAPLHNPRFAADPSALSQAATLLAAIAENRMLPITELK
jgi:amidohydrolase